MDRKRSGRVPGKIISPCLDPVEALDALVAAECKRRHARPAPHTGRLQHDSIVGTLQQQHAGRRGAGQRLPDPGPDHSPRAGRQGAKAPAVYWGDELIAEDGGKNNGMVSFTEMSDIMEIEGVPKHPTEGRLMASPKAKHDALKEAIKDVK